MSTTTPPYTDITGISRAVMKDNAQESLVNYDGNARPGELVVDLTIDPPTLYVGNNQGNLTLVSTGGGGGGNYGNANVVAYAEAGFAGNIIPSTDATYSLGNATNQWADLYVSNATIYMGGVPITMTSGNILQVDGNNVVTGDTSGTVVIDTTSNAVITTSNTDASITIQTVQPQEPWWYSVYGDLGIETGDDYGQGAARDSNGNTYIVGGDGVGGVVTFLAKFGPLGALLWQKTFSLGGDYKSGESVIVDNADNVYATVSDQSTGYVYLVKADPTGTILWQREIQTAGADVSNMAVDSSNNVYLVLTSTARTLFKFSSSGTLEWQKETLSTTGAGVAVDSGGNVYAGGGAGVVTKFTSAGAVVNQVAITDINAYDITVDPAGNSYIGAAYSLGLIQKLDQNGNSVWRTFFNNLNTAFYSIEYCAENNSVIGVGASSYESLSYDLNIVSLDADTGAVNWFNGFGSSGSDGNWYSDATGFLSVKGNVFSTAGYTDVGSTPKLNVIVFSAPVDGSGLGTYGDFTYRSMTADVTTTVGSSAPSSATSQSSAYVITTNSLTVGDNSYTADTVELSPGSTNNYVFASDGTLTFPDATQQSTALSTGMDFTFGNLRTLANTVALGNNAGKTNQGVSAVAIGQLAGSTNQANNSIVINATGSALENTTANTMIVKPVREVTGGVAPVGFSPVYYNPTTGEFIVVTP